MSSSAKPPMAGSPSAALQLENVAVHYPTARAQTATLKEYVIRLLQRRIHRGTFWALRDFSLSVPRGQVIGIIGRNGAGKSTLLKVIGRVIRPTQGRVVVRGRVAPLLEFGAGFHPELTGRENVFLNGAILGFSRTEMQAKFQRIVDFAELWEFIDAPLRTYSSGMVARLGFAIAMDAEPDILILDEVLSVGDVEFQRKSSERIHDFQKRGVTILLVSHNLDVISGLCEHAVWINEGQCAASGTTVDVIAAYTADMLNRQMQRTTQPLVPGQLSPGSIGTPLQILDVRFVGSDGAARQAFMTGETLIARISYRATQRVPAPVFGIAIHRSDGVHVSGTNTRLGSFPIAWIEGDGQVDFILTQLPLLTGDYDFSVTVHDATLTIPFALLHRRFRFTVNAPDVNLGVGILALTCDWAHRAG